jgi:hypothetical protein
MQQRGGMDEFDEGGGLDAGAAGRLAGATGQYHQQGPQAFATAGNDVFGDVVDQRDNAFQAPTDGFIDRGQVVADPGCGARPVPAAGMDGAVGLRTLFNCLFLRKKTPFDRPGTA